MQVCRGVVDLWWYRVGVGVGGAVTECVCDGTEFLEGTRLKVQGGLELFNC